MRETRGQLSAFDRLPPEADALKVWAVSELRERNRTQEEIREELNEGLAKLGIDPIGRSSFNRQSIKIATQQRLEETVKASYQGLKVDDQSADAEIIGLNDTLKTLLHLISMDPANLNPKDLRRMSLTLNTIQATEKDPRARERIRRAQEEKVEEVIEVASREGGLTAEMKGAIRREVLGVRE